MKQFNLLFALMLMSYCGSAQVMYTNVSPVRVLDGSTSSNKIDSVKMHLAHPLSATIGRDSALHIWHFDAAPPGSKDVGVDCRGMEVECLKLSTSLVPAQFAAIDSGVMIDASAGTWQRPNYARLAIQVPPDNWDNQTDKYLGVRFRRNAKWYYGWIKMSIDALPTKAEIKGYAYEATAEKGIIAGNKGSGSGTSVASSAAIQNVRVSSYHKTVVFSRLQHNYNATIIDMNGKVVHSTTVDAQNNTMQLQQLPGGMYIVKLQSGAETGVYKFVL